MGDIDIEVTLTLVAGEREGEKLIYMITAVSAGLGRFAKYM